MKFRLTHLLSTVGLAASLIVGAAPALANDAVFGATDAFRNNGTSVAYDTGIKFERLTFWWSGMQDGPGKPLNPFYLPTTIVDGEKAHGITTIGVVDSTPDWASSDPSQGPRAVPKNLNLPYNDPNNYWGQYLTALAKMYAGKIDTWSIWNEPDISPGDPNAQYYVFAGDVSQYAQVLKIGYQAIKAGNPNAKVMSAGLTYWTDIYDQKPQYFGRLLNELAKDPSAPANNWYFDIATVHLYTNPEGVFKIPNLYHQFMQSHGFDKPIWLNETNVIPYDDPVNAGTPNSTPQQMRSTLDEQANYMIQSVAMARAAGIDHIEAYRMKDGDGDVLNGEALVRADLSKRPEYDTWKLAIKLLSTGTPTLFAPNDLREVVFDQGATRVTVLWDASPTPISVQVPAAGAGATMYDKTGNAQPLSADGGVYGINLAGATMHTDQDNPKAYLIGGQTQIIVETGVAPGKPVDSANNLSPATYDPFHLVATAIAGQKDNGDVAPTGYTYGVTPGPAPQLG